VSATYAPSTIAELANRLERRRDHSARLARSLHQDAVRVLEDPDLSDLLDNHNPGAGTSDTDRHTVLRLAHMAERAATAAEQALRRIEAGTYGTCVRCGDRIALARLRAVPDTEHCLDCKGRAGRLLALAG
jgi:DnaK suppressor protein